jgi:hypothetical protein
MFMAALFQAAGSRSKRYPWHRRMGPRPAGARDSGRRDEARGLPAPDVECRGGCKRNQRRCAGASDEATIWSRTCERQDPINRYSDRAWRRLDQTANRRQTESALLCLLVDRVAADVGGCINSLLATCTRFIVLPLCGKVPVRRACDSSSGVRTACRRILGFREAEKVYHHRSLASRSVACQPVQVRDWQAH